MSELDSAAQKRPFGQREIRLAPRLAKVIVAVVIASYGAVNTVRFTAYQPPLALVIIGLADLAAILLLQIFYFGSMTRRNAGGRLRMLGLQAVLVYAPLPWLSEGWLGVPSFLAASCLLVLPPRAAWSAFAAIILTNLSQVVLFGDNTVFDLTYIFSASVNAALVVYGLIRMSEFVTEVHASRAKLAQAAVEKERLRFARDLHDLLGYSLSTIILKIELSRRLGATNWARAAEELDGVLSICRQALSDVRMVSSGYRQMSLETELQSARAILSAAGIDTEIRIGLDLREVLDGVSTALSTVLREGITNILRHTDAQTCEMILDRHAGRVRLTLVNDGLRADMADDCVGSGIANLTMRVEALGGWLRAGARPDGLFELIAEVEEDGRPSLREVDLADERPASSGWRSWLKAVKQPGAS